MDDIVKKIQKLLALSKSSNQAEAELAAIKANELLLKYKLSLSDIEETEESLSVISYGDVFIKMHSWKIVLLRAVCRSNACDFYLQTDGNRKRFNIIGEATNIKVTEMMIEYLMKSIERISKKDIPRNAKIKYKDDFKFGMAYGIGSRLYENINEIDPSAKALILTSSKRIKDYFDKQDFSSIKNNFEIEKDTAFQRGINSSKKVSLNKQCDAHSKERLA